MRSLAQKEKISMIPADFATKLVPERLEVIFLYKNGGASGSSISIVKEIWINVTGRGDGLGDGVRFPVFHIYNYIDPSKAFTPYSGSRTNDLDNPYLDFEKCLQDAQQMAEEAEQSGLWVHFEQIERK